MIEPKLQARAASDLPDVVYRRDYATVPSPIDGSVFCFNNFDGAPTLAVRSVENARENYSQADLTIKELDDCNNVVTQIHRMISSMLIEHAAYWKSALWC